MFPVAILSSPPFGLADPLPIRRSITGAVKMLDIHKTFQKQGTMVVTILEVFRKFLDDHAKEF